METDNTIDDFLSQYDELVSKKAMTLRDLIIAHLPNITVGTFGQIEISEIEELERKIVE